MRNRRILLSKTCVHFTHIYRISHANYLSRKASISLPYQIWLIIAYWMKIGKVLMSLVSGKMRLAEGKCKEKEGKKIRIHDLSSSFLLCAFHWSCPLEKADLSPPVYNICRPCKLSSSSKSNQSIDCPLPQTFSTTTPASSDATSAVANPRWPLHSPSSPRPFRGDLPELWWAHIGQIYNLQTTIPYEKSYSIM